MSSREEKFLTMKSNDDKSFTVKESVAFQSVTIKKMVEDGCASSTIPLPSVDSGTLAVVLEYLNKHGDTEVSVEDKRRYDSEEIAKKTMQELFDIFSAANYLDIKGLLEVVTQAITDNIKDMKMEDVPTTSGGENDLTPEEEEDFARRTRGHSSDLS